MQRLSWKQGPERDDGHVYVSATHFKYRSLRHLPAVFWHGLRLRRRWHGVDGAIGMFTGSDLVDRSTYTVTAWTSPDALEQWLVSPEHARLMRAFKPHLESAASFDWWTERFEPRAAWREAMIQLGAPRAHAPLR